MSACESTPHHHVDVAASVAAASRRSSSFALATLALATLLAAAAAVVEPAGWPAALRAGAGWVASALAAATTLLAVGGTGGAGRGRAGPALVGSAVAGALATVAAAWWVAASGGHPVWAAAGWALTAALFQATQSVAWRRTLRRPGDAGEFARDQAVHGSDHPQWRRRLGWWALPVAAFGVWTWALGLLPVTVLVVAPATVALHLGLARRTLAGTR